MSDLAFGGILGLLVFKNKLVGWIKGLRSSQLFLIYLIGLGLIFTDSFYLFGTLSIFERLIPSIFFSFMILEQVYSEQSLFKVDRIKGFFHAGEISYGFYMFHCIVLYYMSILFSEMGWVYNISGFILYVITSLVCTHVLAHYSYAYFERPFLKLKKFFQ
jgi:peptidoglycan/LPS O-acetylase OafA/YrhL